VNSNLSVNTGMTEKEIEQKFRADFRRLFPKLKDATAGPCHVNVMRIVLIISSPYRGKSPILLLDQTIYSVY